MEAMKAAIFDMDGTILDSTPMWDHVAAAVVRQMGAEPRESIRRDTLPLGMREFAPFLKTDYALSQSLEEIDGAVEAQVRRYYFEEAELKPGALGFLQALKATGVRLGLATATERWLLEPAMEKTGALELFDAIFTCPEVGFGKQNPEVFRRTAEALGVRHDQAWVFEDSLHAIRTAKADGFLTCAVADPSTVFQWDEIREAADCSMENFSERPLPFVPGMDK